VWDCPVNGCMVCMPPVAIALAPADIEALKAERDRYREALREIVAYNVAADDDGYLDALALQDKARGALDG
jgi:hypothetical protein